MSLPQTHPDRPRGACPTLDAPMAVADGLLARLRPSHPLDARHLRALAEAATRFGNGRIDLTTRASLQLRGVDEQGATALPEMLSDAGLAWTRGLAIDTSPLAGLDPFASGDARALAIALAPSVASANARLTLAPKLSLVIDDGGVFALSRLPADLRFVANGNGGWRFEIAGRSFAEVAAAEAPALLSGTLHRLAALGPAARGRDLGDGVNAQAAAAPLPAPGPVALPDGRTAQLFAAPYGQLSASQVEVLAEAVDAAGPVALHLAPHRLLVAIGGGDAIARLSSHLPGLDSAPTPRLPLCVGAETDGRETLHSPDLAAALVDANPRLADGSAHLHTGSCAKGCPHRHAPGLMLAERAGKLVLLHHPAAGEPLAQLGGAGHDSALATFARRFADSASPGISAIDTLRRLQGQQ